MAQPSEQLDLDRARVLLTNLPEMKPFLERLRGESAKAQREAVQQEETHNIFRAQGKARWLQTELELIESAKGRLEKARG